MSNPTSTNRTMKNAAAVNAEPIRSSAEIMTELKARRARLDELEVRRAGLSDAVQAATEEIAKGVASGNETGLEAVRKKKRADADELDELASAVSMMNGEIKALEAQLDAAGHREALADADRLDRELREDMQAFQDRLDAFMAKELPNVEAIRAKARDADHALIRADTFQKVDGTRSMQKQITRRSEISTIVDIVEGYAENNRRNAVVRNAALRRSRIAGTPADPTPSDQPVDTRASDELIEATA